MNFISRFFKRLKFRKSIKQDQSRNVVDGMVKARKLYKELSRQAHPDRHPTKRDVAEDLMKRLVENRYNYKGLIILQEEIKNKLEK